jgi:hypothetical protein
MRLYIGLTYTKAQIASGTPVQSYVGSDLNACKAAVAAIVDSGSASRGIVKSTLFQENRVTRRNLSGA